MQYSCYTKVVQVRSQYIYSLQVVDWILGPAEKLLMSQKGIGYSYKEAEELRKQHEQLELRCTVSTFKISNKVSKVPSHTAKAIS